MRALPLLLAVVGSACHPPFSGEGERVPDFRLLDVNPASPSAGTSVSPRDYEGRVSGWYFGHSG